MVKTHPNSSSLNPKPSSFAETIFRVETGERMEYLNPEL
jgi:hypothetical protein